MNSKDTLRIRKHFTYRYRKERIEREKNLRPGDLDWFKLWFSRPYWKGQEYPPGLRGRKK